MAVTVASVLAEVRRLLQDTGVLAFRYDAPSLLNALNLGQFAITKLDPLATSTIIPHTLTSGVRQTLPTDALQYFRVNCVLVSTVPTTVVTTTTVDELDVAHPLWRAATGSKVLQAAPDPYDPSSFYVYPAAVGAVQVQYSRTPSLVVDGTLNISLPDRYQLALQHFMVYKILEQDSDDESNETLAAKHYQHFMGALFGPKAVGRPPKGDT
jgi:hypothetical protein